MYILKLNIVVFSDENLDLEAEITEKLESTLLERQACFVSSSAEDVTGDNYGRCSVCGCWVSDNTKPEHINAFSNGAKIGKQWFCDICIPANHPSAF